MEITYNVIIKYLCEKQDNVAILEKIELAKFITQKNIFSYSASFPDKFKNLLTDKFYRYGITTHDNENNNISFWSTLLTLLDKKFIIPFTNDEIEIINQFKNQLIEQYSKQKLSAFLKDLDKNDLRERFKLQPDIYILQYIVDILDINILIMNFKTINIYSVYRKDIMNPWKQTLIIANYDNNWEPIMSVKAKGNTQRLFDYNDAIIKKLITTDKLISYFETEKISKDFICMENIQDVITLEKTKLKISSNKTNKELINDKLINDELINDEIISDHLFVEKDELEEIKLLNKTKLNKMKLAELQEICIKLKINIDTNKTPTRAVLIELILNKKILS